MTNFLGIGSSGAVGVEGIVQNYRGSAAQPSMDYEAFEMTKPVQLVFGNGNQAVLQALTINSSGGTSPAIQIWRISAAQGSSSIATITHPSNAAGVTLWYNASCPKGFIVNWATGIGDITVTYRETALGQ